MLDDVWYLWALISGNLLSCFSCSEHAAKAVACMWKCEFRLLPECSFLFLAMGRQYESSSFCS
jgi:hypothetical protein